MQNWPQLFPKQVVIVRQISKELQYSLPEERKTVLYVGIKSNKNNHKKRKDVCNVIEWTRKLRIKLKKNAQKR